MGFKHSFFSSDARRNGKQEYTINEEESILSNSWNVENPKTLKKISHNLLPTHINWSATNTLHHGVTTNTTSHIWKAKICELFKNVMMYKQIKTLLVTRCSRHYINYS